MEVPYMARQLNYQSILMGVGVIAAGLLGLYSCYSFVYFAVYWILWPHTYEITPTVIRTFVWLFMTIVMCMSAIFLRQAQVQLRSK